MRRVLVSGRKTTYRVRMKYYASILGAPRE